MAVTLTREEFEADPQGRLFKNVDKPSGVAGPGFDLGDWITFFNEPDRQRRMLESEIHHDRPALAGVIKELERHPAFADFLANNDAHSTLRGRQCLGVLVAVYMDRLGWRKTGRKGSLGRRVAVDAGTQTPGAYHNTPDSLSRWLTKTERYEPKHGEIPFRD